LREAKGVLWVVAASLLGVELDWCDEECFERAHPITTRLGFGKIFGGPELQYGLSLSTARSERVHRFQLGWALPLGDTLELSTGAGLSSDGRIDLAPSLRYSPFKLGSLLVPAVSLATLVGWRGGALEMRVRPCAELHVGLAAMMFAFEIDVAGVVPPRFWWGVQVGL
jgi:hypothetical protein